MVVDINGHILEVIIIRKNIKGTYLRLRNNQILISTNRHVSNERIMNFINQQREWIENKLNNIIEFTPKEDEFLFFGEKYHIIIDNKMKELYKIVNGILYLKKYNAIKNVYEYGYKMISEEFFRIVGKVKLQQIPTLSFRKMNTKWGVCHYREWKVVLNKALILLPLSLIQYIIYHELTHFFHPNHSKKFYTQLSIFCPQYQQYQKELRKYYINK